MTRPAKATATAKASRSALFLSAFVAALGLLAAADFASGRAEAAVAGPADLAERGSQRRPRRLALLVAHPKGGPDTQTLRYPARDAEKMAAVLTELGGFAPEDVMTLVAPDAGALIEALEALERTVRGAEADGQRTLLLFYYSGHAAAGELRLGDTRLSLADLKSALARSHAQVRVAFLDACESGAITRLKGGQRGPSFVVDVAPTERSQGMVLITSSSAEESSQESDELRGSFFTHHLVSGMRGAADREGDAIVSLSEAYAYAYHHTVSQTAGTRGGTQHPTYTYDLQGSGDVALTRLGGRGALLFPSDADGSYLVYNQERDVVVGEVHKTMGGSRRLSVPPGHYIVKKRGRERLLLQEVTVRAHTQQVIEEAAFRAVPFEDDVTKGPLWIAARRSEKRQWTVSAAVGVQAFFDAPTRASLLHPTALLGVRVEWLNGIAHHLSLQLDVALGGTKATVQAGYYDAPDDVDFRIFLGGVAMNYGGWAGPILLQIGPRLTAVYAQRSFVRGGTPDQDLFTISPGIGASVGWRLGALTLGLETKAHYLQYSTETANRSLGFGEIYLSLGYTP